MMLYKLTDENGYTHGRTLWGEGVTHSGTGEGELCGPGWIHCYTSPYSAILLNTIHANFPSPKVWKAEGKIVKRDKGLKYGCKTLTTLHEIYIRKISTERHIHFGILCAREVYKEVSWNKWAVNWIEGRDRSKAAAYAAHSAACAAHSAAYAAYAASCAASAAAYAAHSAACAADYSAYAAYAADSAARAADYAACASNVIPIDELAEKAYTTKLIGEN